MLPGDREPPSVPIEVINEVGSSIGNFWSLLSRIVNTVAKLAPLRVNSPLLPNIKVDKDGDMSTAPVVPSASAKPFSSNSW